MINQRFSRICVQCASNIVKTTNFACAPLARFSTGQFNFQNIDGKAENQPQPRKKKRKEILKIPESELEGYAIGTKKLPLFDRRGETQSVYRHIVDTDTGNKVDFLNWAHADLDFRPATLKRWWTSVEAEYEISEQIFNEKRYKILGSDLSAAHFILARKGKIRFKGHDDWIKHYRKDMVTGKEDDVDLPAMTFELCSVPTKYDPRFRLEAIDAAHMTIIYEGLSNLENLDYVKWLSFRNCPHIDDWCLDKIFRLFNEKLEYLDISGCAKISQRSIGAVRRCSKLKTLVVEDMEHVKDLAVVCAQLEDEIPGLTVFGVDYATKLLELRQKSEVEKFKELKAAVDLESSTITVEPPSPDSETANEEQQQQQSSPAAVRKN